MTFINTLKGIYFKKLVSSIISNFSDLIINIGQIKYAIRQGKLSNDFARTIEPNAKKQFFSEEKDGR